MTEPAFQKIRFADLSDNLKLNFNFQKISAILVDYGFATFWTAEEWSDFLAIHKDRGGRDVWRIKFNDWITVMDKYRGKDVRIAVPYTNGWFVYPHDTMLELIEDVTPFQHTPAWQENKLYSWHSPSNALLDMLAPYFISGDTCAGR